MVLPDMNVTSNSGDKICPQVSTMCVRPPPNPTLPRKVLLTVPVPFQAWSAKFQALSAKGRIISALPGANSLVAVPSRTRPMMP